MFKERGKLEREYLHKGNKESLNEIQQQRDVLMLKCILNGPLGTLK